VEPEPELRCSPWKLTTVARTRQAVLSAHCRLAEQARRHDGGLKVSWLEARNGRCQSKIEYSARMTDSNLAAIDFPRLLGALSEKIRLVASGGSL
jgi:hypothetical protein